MKQAEVLRKQIQYYSYVIGAIILLMFGNTVGNNGIAYLAIAMETIGIFMVILGDNVAEVYGTMLHFRRKRKQYYDALEVKKRITVLQLILGLVCFLVVFSLADVIAADVFKIPNAALLIRILSPILFLRMLSSLLIGYFQGFGAQMPAVFSSVLRQVLFLILGKLFCSGLLTYGEKVAALLRNDDFYGMYGACGLACSIVVSEIVILCALVIFYFVSDRDSDKKKSEEGLHKAESLQDTLQSFYSLAAPGVGFSLLKRLFTVAVLIILIKLEEIGLYYGKYLVICAVPVLLAAARYYVLYARLIGAIKNKNGRQVREKIQLGLLYGWSTGILATVLLAVLTPHIVNTFFVDNQELISVLRIGAFLILPVILFCNFAMVHSAHKKKLVSILMLAGCFVLFVILGNVLGSKMTSQLLALVYAGVIAFYAAVILFGAVTLNQYHVKPDYVPTFIMPLACVGVIGIILLLFGNLLAPHIGTGLTCLLGLILGVVLYLVALGFCKVFSDNDIEQIYGNLGKRILLVIFK